MKTAPQVAPFAAIDAVGTPEWLATWDVLRAMGTASLRAVYEKRATLIPYRR